VAGFSFGAWIGMQLLMRRPEIEGFVSIAPPANMYDFSFLAPCPSSGLILQGTEDDVVPEPSVEKLANKLKMQKNITIDYQLVKGANHFFKDHMDQLVTSVSNYVDARMGTTANTAARRKASAQA
jgi:alpha/beta superfamily hydrolase